MKPYVGQSVLVMGIKANGSDLHPAVITRLWGKPDHDLDTDGVVAVNLTIFPDAEPPLQRTSVPLFSTRPLALGSGSQLSAYPNGH